MRPQCAQAQGPGVSRGPCALAHRVHEPGGDGSPLHAGGRCSGWVVSEGRPEPCGCRCTGQGETGRLSALRGLGGWDPDPG